MIAADYPSFALGVVGLALVADVLIWLVIGSTALTWWRRRRQR